MTTSRTIYTATLLLDGRVLVAGGAGDLASAELYDPGTGRWTATGSMAHGRSAQTATRLQDGRVLVAGGSINPAGDQLASAELYDPAAGRWTATGSLNTVRSGHTATLLPDGKVLVAGGTDLQRMQLESLQLAALTAAELYDPATGIWAAIGSMTEERTGHTATLLPDGRVLVAGGNLDGGAFGATAELYDPATGRWARTGNMTDSRMHHAATLLPDGRVLVSGGMVGSDYTSDRQCSAGGPPSVCSAEQYDPSMGRWTATGSMHADRIGHRTTLLPDGTVLVVGLGVSFGQPDAAPVAELYHPGSGQWTATASPAKTRGLTATLLLDGRVLATGGDSDSRVTELYYPAVGS
jgi:WD40 repeat protein